MHCARSKKSLMKSNPEKSKKSNAGRKTILTPELKLKLFELIRLGQPLERACLVVGINRQTITNWEQRAETDEACKEFLEGHKRARAEGEANMLQQIHNGGNHWQRFAWLLERRYHEDYGRKLDANFRSDGDVRVIIEWEK